MFCDATLNFLILTSRFTMTKLTFEKSIFVHNVYLSSWLDRQLYHYDNNTITNSRQIEQTIDKVMTYCATVIARVAILLVINITTTKNWFWHILLFD